jgi:energy-coupling factor transporter ATP-binding protein EcfA2
MSRFVPSDRAIESPEDDLFKRSSFVNRLVSSLVVDYEHYSIAAGVTVGLIGPWGTGKSSILNLIERELAAQYPNSICVRFNPWLVSGHQELIGQFFSEFVSVLQGNRELRTNAYELIDDLKAYGRLIGGIADLALPGLGVFPNGLAGLLERQILRGRSLEALHTSISDSLGRIRVPVVVLIDELDRVEDAEVRAVARLINAVAGFPRVSYLVAYDWERVTEALDGGVSNRGRGRRYLEKIIQHQVAMPDLSSVEVTDFFQDALDGYSAELSLPESYSDDDRYKRLLFIVVPGIISTLRDAKRVVGSFSILRRIVGAEVNWVDLLGWVVICEKYPDVRRSILDHQEYVAEDAFTRMYLAWRQSDGKSKDASDHLEAIGVSDSEEFYSESLVGLLGLLFPSLNKLGEEKDRVVLPLASQRGLGLVSRYGLSERDVSIRVIDEFMNADLENQLSMLQSLHIGENLVAFLDQMEEFHAEFSREQRLRFWVSFSAFLRDNQPVPPPVSEAFYIYSETARSGFA